MNYCNIGGFLVVGAATWGCGGAASDSDEPSNLGTTKQAMMMEEGPTCPLGTNDDGSGGCVPDDSGGGGGGGGGTDPGVPTDPGPGDPTSTVICDPRNTTYFLLSQSACRSGCDDGLLYCTDHSDTSADMARCWAAYSTCNTSCGTLPCP